eukprot:8476624-Lingulodinium_polyedra.AAC.1
MPAVQALGKRAWRIRFDACQHGAASHGGGAVMKPTVLLTNAAWLRPLGLRCSGGHAHVQLQGKVFVASRRAWINRTALAAEYPWLL